MSVARVFAQAHVRNHDKPRRARLDRAYRAAHRPLLVPRTAALLVLVVGNAEEKHRFHAGGYDAVDDFAQAVDRVLRDARH